MKKLVTLSMALIGASLIAIGSAIAAAEHEQDHKADAEAATVTVTGEVLDLACYLDHGATGGKHAECAQTCIEGGLPVGIKDKDGKVYLLIGDHKPLNKKLGPLASKTITVSGKAVSRDGLNMIENAQIVK